VGIGTATPDASAALEISSTSKGVLLPRLTITQLQALDPKVEGLIVYCTDCVKKGIYMSNGISFSEISDFAAHSSLGTDNPSLLISKAIFNNLFPYRADITGAVRTSDFYSYENFGLALQALKSIKIQIWRQEQTEADATDDAGNLESGFSLFNDGTRDYYYSDYLSKIIRKKTGEADVERYSSSDWSQDYNLGKTQFLQKEIDYGDFLNNGTLTKNNKELAAFLAQISHETGTDTTNNDGRLNGGLVYKSEQACSPGGAHYNTDTCDYIDLTNQNDVNYPPGAGVQYYGRGPMQTSWNYNYGLLSWVLYGDVNVLLQDPEKVIENGVTAFSSAIHFWMYPNDKPSSHEVINTSRGFAKTINIINGGLECGSANNNDTVDAKVSRRISFYRTYSDALGYVDIESDASLKCFDLTPY
jgi:predicted chitinase